MAKNNHVQNFVAEYQRYYDFSCILAVFWLFNGFSTTKFCTRLFFARCVQKIYKSDSLLLHQCLLWHDCSYMPIFFVVWALVTILVIIKFSAESLGNSLVIPIQAKIHRFLPNFDTSYSPLYEVFFNDLGMDWFLFLQEKTTKLISDVFQTFRHHIQRHIGTALSRFLLYFALYRIHTVQ